MVPIVNNKYNSTQATKVLWTRFEIVLEGSNRFEKKGLGSKGGKPPPVIKSHNFTFSSGALSSEPPCVVQQLLK
jgi:hypothetical protein